MLAKGGSEPAKGASMALLSLSVTIDQLRPKDLAKSAGELINNLPLYVTDKWTSFDSTDFQYY